jgi:hypothetical protein
MSAIQKVRIESEQAAIKDALEKSLRNFDEWAVGARLDGDKADAYEEKASTIRLMLEMLDKPVCFIIGKKTSDGYDFDWRESRSFQTVDECSSRIKEIEGVCGGTIADQFLIPVAVILLKSNSGQ